VKHEALKVWRRIDGHTQETMAELLDVTPRRYRDMENAEGCYAEPGELWLRAVRALNVRWNLIELVGRLREAHDTILQAELGERHGWHVRAARIVRGQTLAEFGGWIGVDKSDLCLFERGRGMKGRKIYRDEQQGFVAGALMLAIIDVKILLEEAGR